jgi:hypothetical protein
MLKGVQQKKFRFHACCECDAYDMFSEYTFLRVESVNRDVVEVEKFSKKKSF